MTPLAIEPAQRTWARVIGLCYVFGQIPAIFAEFYVTGQLIVSDNAAETARNIVAHERLFRLGTASNFIVFAGDIVLIAALYVVLERVNRNLALLAAFFRLIETAVLFAALLTDFEVLRVLSGADYLRGLDPAQLQTLARLSIGAHGSAYNVGLVLFGLGSSVFACLWSQSGYIPRALAAWGVFSSVLIAVCAFAFIIFPELRTIVTIGYYAGPIFLFEVGLGLWLLVRGIRAPTRA